MLKLNMVNMQRLQLSRIHLHMIKLNFHFSM